MSRAYVLRGRELELNLRYRAINRVMKHSPIAVFCPFCRNRMHLFMWGQGEFGYSCHYCNIFVHLRIVVRRRAGLSVIVSLKDAYLVIAKYNGDEYDAQFIRIDDAIDVKKLVTPPTLLAYLSRT